MTLLNAKSADVLRAERAELLEEADKLAAKIERGDDLTAGETARFDELTAADGLIVEATAELQEREKFETRRDEVRRAKVGDSNRAPRFAGGPHPDAAQWGEHHRPTGREAGEVKLRDGRGEWHTAYAATTPINKPKRDDLPTAGEVLAFALTHNEDYLDGRDYNASIGSGTAGGYFVDNQIWGEVVDLARAAMVTGRAGARTVNMAEGSMTIVKVTGDPTPGYVAELGAIPVSNASFSQLVLQPKKLAVLIPVSREAVEDAGNLAQQLQVLAVRAVAQTMDLCMLAGTNAGQEPGGIIGTTGVNTETSVGTPTSYADIISAVTSIYSANYSGDVSGLSWLHSAREWGTYAGLVTTGSGADGQPLQVPPAISDLQRYTTTALPIDGGGGSDGTMIVGDFSQALFAVRMGTGVSVEILNSGAAGGIDAVANDAIWIRVVQRFDTAVLRPDWFTVLTGVTAS